MRQITKRKIVFLINSLGIGGAENVFLAQANELHKRDWDVYIVTLFSPGALIDRLRVPHENIYTLSSTSLFDIRAFLKLLRYIRSINTDILYTTLNEANTLGRILRILLPRMNLLTREANMADIKPAIYKCADIFLGFLSTKIIVVSSAVGDSVAYYAPWLKKRMLILYNGVRVPEDVTVRSIGSNIKLLTIGSLTPKKDHAILIEAMKILPTSFSLTIVGSGGGLRDRLNNSVQEAQLTDRVTFLGAVPPEETENLYRSHDLFILPSQREGCPNVVSEAQSFALPVVAFDIPGMNEFVDETCGVLVKTRSASMLATAINEISKNREHMNVLGMQGYRRVSLSRDYSTQFEALLSLLVSIV